MEAIDHRFPLNICTDFFDKIDIDFSRDINTVIFA